MWRIWCSAPNLFFLVSASTRIKITWQLDLLLFALRSIPYPSQPAKQIRLNGSRYQISFEASWMLRYLDSFSLVRLAGCVKDFSTVFKLLVKFKIFNRSMNFSQNNLFIVSYPNYKCHPCRIWGPVLVRTYHSSKTWCCEANKITSPRLSWFTSNISK